MTLPLLLHLVFHPKSDNARELAMHLYKDLNSDSLIPGLRVPTRILPESEAGSPPCLTNLDRADREMVVLLADDVLNAEHIDGTNSESWREFVGELAKSCNGTQRRFVPLQLSTFAWPIHESLRKINFARVYAEPCMSQRSWVSRRLVIEACRMMLGQSTGPKAPITVFLSHAKQDLENDPKAFYAVTEHLKTTQPVNSWIDSASIDPGEDFEDRIRHGVKASAVLVVLTESYSQRTWCRKEVLLAKKEGRPLVVLDALKGCDRRSFPYLGNVPVISWDDNAPQRAIDLLMKEWLRRLYAQLLLAAKSKPEDVRFSAMPELATLALSPPKSSVLYPDPPLGDEELALLEPLGHVLSTPIQRAACDRTLADKSIALSISNSDSTAAHGCFPDHLDAALMEISRHLLAGGSRLLYGGHLGAESYTIALLDLVAAHRKHATFPPSERIVNYVGWPLVVNQEQRSRYAGLASFVSIGMPALAAPLDLGEVEPTQSAFAIDTADRRMAWALGMSAMRQRQSADMDARIILGGKIGPTLSPQPDGPSKISWYTGRIPGVVEEFLTSMDLAKPVYLCGGFGGAAHALGELLMGRLPDRFTWEYQKQAPYSIELKERFAWGALPWEDYEAMAARIGAYGIPGLAKTNGLSNAENLELIGTRDTDRIIELLLSGMNRVFESDH